MEQNNPNPPSTPLGQHVPWSTPTIPQSPINMGDLNQHLAASLNDGIEVYDAIQSTPTTWEPTPPVSSVQMELQGTPTRLNPITDNTINQQGVIVDGEDSWMASPIQYNDDHNERDSSEPLCLGIKLGPSSQSSLHAAIVRAAEMEHGCSLKHLPEKTRQLIEEIFCTNSGFDQVVKLPEEPETINIRSGSTPHASRARSKGRDHLCSLAWTHLTYESGCSDELAYFREAIPVPTNIAEFFGDIKRAIKHPMLAPPIDLSDMEVEGDKGDEVYGVGYSAGQKEDLAAMIQDLWEEISRDISECASGWSEFYLRDMIKLRVGTSIPANIQDFNDSMGMVLAALDTGLDDDLTTKGVTPSSWFRLSATLLAAMTQGVLRSGGPKVKGRVKLVPDKDHFRVAPGLGMPLTEGSRIILMARHLAELFKQHDKGDNLPFVEYFNNLQRVTQNHIRQAVKLAAVEAYQESTGDAEKIREIVMDDMADQLINQLKDDPAAQAEVERYHLVQNDDNEEQEGRAAKCAIPNVTPVTKPQRLDGSVTPQAKKNKKKKNGGRKLIILKPFSTAGSEASSTEDGMEEDPLPPPDFRIVSPPVLKPIQPISVPTNVRASQQPSGPLRDPITVLVNSISNSSPDPLRGVASSMHNPKNIMEEDLNLLTNDDRTPEAPAPATAAIPATSLAALPTLLAIPLLPGLSELLNTLQTNITAALSSQISSLIARMDQQDICITSITKPTASKGKGVAKTRETPPHLPSTTAPGVRPDAVAHPPTTPTPGASPDVAATNPVPGQPMGPPLGPPPTVTPTLQARKNSPVPVPRNATRWASIITSSTYAGQTAARAGAITNTGTVGRTVTGGKKAGGTPAYLINTEITVMRGKGLKDPKKEEAVRNLSPNQIIQSVWSQMEKLTASPPMLMCGRWSTKPGSLNFVALCELEQEWGFNTAELDSLVCIQTRYAVKNHLPLCVPQVKDTIAREVMKDTRNGITQIQEVLKAFKDKWGSFSPMKYIESILKNKHFVSEDEIKVFNKQCKSAGDKAREVQDAVVFVGNLVASLYKNNEVNRKISSDEAETLVIMHDLHIQPADGVGVGPCAANVIKDYLKHPLALFNAMKMREAHA
ncbi:hypothetical protein BJY52DRAFT_1191349 [Lactarius psammicola]|nr:hypothetical protein BJY52DRAFT_1191349 [Lactarius psammicola]